MDDDSVQCAAIVLSFDEIRDVQKAGWPDLVLSEQERMKTAVDVGRLHAASKFCSKAFPTDWLSLVSRSACPSFWFPVALCSVAAKHVFRAPLPFLVDWPVTGLPF